MKATVTNEFEDIEAGVRRKPGDVIDINAERAAVLRNANVIGEVIPERAPVETAAREAPEKAVTRSKKR